MHARPVVAVSRCLLGQRTRYDGGGKYAPLLMCFLAEQCEILPVCPEVEGGLPVPREPIELSGSCLDLRTRGVCSGRDYSPAIFSWCARNLDRFRCASGFVLKAGSPTCACVTPKGVWSPAQWPSGLPLDMASGPAAGSSLGVFARLLSGHFPDAPMADEVHLATAMQREDFLHRVLRHRERMEAPCE